MLYVWDVCNSRSINVFFKQLIERVVFDPLLAGYGTVLIKKYCHGQFTSTFYNTNLIVFFFFHFQNFKFSYRRGIQQTIFHYADFQLENQIRVPLIEAIDKNLISISHAFRRHGMHNEACDRSLAMKVIV